MTTTPAGLRSTEENNSHTLLLFVSNPPVKCSEKSRHFFIMAETAVV